MKAWIIQLLIDNIVPVILTALLGTALGLKITKILDAIDTISDALADGKVSKDEWKDIRDRIKAIIGR